MSKHALKIVGFDEHTHHPIRIELTLVTGDDGAEPAPGDIAFGAPRGFLPDEYRRALLQAMAPVAFSAPRGFIPKE